MSKRKETVYIIIKAEIETIDCTIEKAMENLGQESDYFINSTPYSNILNTKLLTVQKELPL